MKEDLSDVWTGLRMKDKRYWETIARLENKGFSFRWKNIWDDGFPGKWIKFLQSNTAAILKTGLETR